MTPGLTVDSVSKRYGPTFSLERVSFNVAPGEILALLGPSGSGKSSLLGLIAGVESPDEGRILWDGQDLAGVPVHRRNFGLMFQDYALFPHKNVYENVAFGLRMRARPEGEVREAVSEALATVGLAGFEKRDVHSLSGGESQRVALARALVPHPRLLMLDEPLGALDRNLRERLMVELPEILNRLGQTAIYVTHDQEEAFAIAGRIVLLDAGRVAQVGRPAEVYAAPASEFVARFLGLTNIVDGRVAAIHPLRVDTGLGPLLASSPDAGAPRVGEAVCVLIRPELPEVPGPGEANPLEGRVGEVSFRGKSTRVEFVARSGQVLTFEIPAGARVPEPGQRVRLDIPIDRVQVIPERQ